MFKQLVLKIVKFLTYIPFLKYLFKFFYLHSIKKIKNEFKGQNSVVDIILTSNLKSRDFVYGHSDLNFLIIVDNDCHPKAVLKDFRAFIASHLELSITVNQDYIPILTESELQTDTIKSYLIRKSYQDLVRWNSILTEKDYTFYLRKQDHFAISYNSFQNLDYYFLREKYQRTKRIKFNFLYRSIQNIKKFYPQFILKDNSWKELSNKIKKHPLINSFLIREFIKNSWQILTHYEESYPINQHRKRLAIPHDFSKYLHTLTSLEFINDFTLTPTLIQNSKHEIQGKLFIDVHVNSNIQLKEYSLQLDNLKRGIKSYEKDYIKFRVRFTTDSLYKLQNEHAFYPFPLEALYRKKKTVSVLNKNYNFLINHDDIILASIHFLTTQFMRFRSHQQQTELIGSKFIKSLNLMYKYFLLSKYLKGKEFTTSMSEKKIREQLTPQFSELDLEDPVTEEHWKIIKAQLLYLLKEIRDELIKHDSSLKVLKF